MPHAGAGALAVNGQNPVTNRGVGELRSFLIAARARVTPESVGIVALGRRRVRGLRRAEVAELAGISETWYTRFETGIAALSVAAVDRVSTALRLDRAERIRLMRLARPDVAQASLGAIEEALSGIGKSVVALRDLVRSCVGAGSVAELGAASTLAVNIACGYESLSYMRAFDDDRQELPIVAVHGRGADALVGHSQKCSTVSYAMPHFRAGRAFAERDLSESPCLELRTRIDRVGVHAYHTHPILGKSGLELMIGVAMRDPRPPLPLEESIVETVATIVELTIRA